MDKNVLKKFAVESRQELMEKVANKINKYFVDEYFDVNQNGEVYILINNKHTLRLTKSEYENRQLLVKRIKEITLEQVIEEAAYTWFNRIIAIRYMEIHNFLPLTKDNQSLGVRVLSSKDNIPDPEIMRISNLINPELDINFNKEYYGSIQDNNKRFEYILLLICKKLGKVIPQVFDGVTDYIDILIPDNLLNESGYISKLLEELSESNFNSVEIIGWLYQYYNQTEKDRVMASNKSYNKNEIPYATQLFTPDWIVKYMVENSLGKMWIEQSGDTNLSKNWKYYIYDTNIKRDKIRDLSLIKFIDPCCGSGHVLVYAFEVFYNIYLSEGYNKNDIAELILSNNLFGLDIDDRAGQLSILSVILKAREYDKNIFNKNIIKNLNILSIPDSETINIFSIDNLKINKNKEVAKLLIDEFKNAKEYGSLMQIEDEDYSSLIEELENSETIFLYDLKNKLMPLIKCSKILSQKYDVVVTNPPYMSSKGMPNILKKFIESNYKSGKSDLFAAFILKCLNMVKQKGYLGMITMQSLMFLSSYTELRKNILNNTICSLLQIGYNSFPELNSQVAHAVSFIISKGSIDEFAGQYYNLNVGKVNADKDKVFLSKINKEYYTNKNKDLLYLPNYIFAYWLSDVEKKILKNYEKLEKKMNIKQGLATGNNEYFVRNWFEVNINKIEFNAHDIDDFHDKGKLYAPYNKGGNFRKWYGNKENVIKFDEINYKKLLNSGNHLPSREFYFKKGITWSLIGNENFAARISDGGFVFDVGGSSGFPLKEDLEYLLAYLCSKITVNFLKALNPTINFQVGDIKNLPISYIDEEKENEITKLSKENISMAKQDWDSFEISWDFKKHPLLEFIDSMPGLHDSNIKVTPTHLKIIKNSYGEECYIADELPLNAKVSDSFRKWEGYTQKQFNTLKKNEEKLNEIFIDIYGLKDELTPEVEDKDIAIRKADKEREIKSLISYAVGCMFGRYSLDKEGLIYAGGDFDEKYKKYKESDGGWAGVSLSNYKVLNDNGNEIDLSFEVDKDNIIPITDEAYLGDDIVERFKKFISVAYGEETLYENLESIAETLGKRNGETSEDTIRRYFINDFYNDHLKIYQKRPIYWLFDSGKKNGFKCLIYMHRYNEGLVSKIRLDYLHKIQNIYEKELKEISNKLDGDIDLTKKRELAKTQADISAKLQETKEYDEKIAHIADQKIKIDLDDGVVVNYAKFSVKNPKTGREESLLAKIK